LMDVTKINALGWEASISLDQGLQKIYEQYKEARTKTLN